MLNINSEKIPEIDEDEIKSSLAGMKSYRTKGKNKITNELIIERGKETTKIPKTLFNKDLITCITAYRTVIEESSSK